MTIEDFKEYSDICKALVIERAKCCARIEAAAKFQTAAYVSLKSIESGSMPQEAPVLETTIDLAEFLRLHQRKGQLERLMIENGFEIFIRHVNEKNTTL